jgi:hypothetical protein
MPAITCYHLQAVGLLIVEREQRALTGVRYLDLDLLVASGRGRAESCGPSA